MRFTWLLFFPGILGSAFSYDPTDSYGFGGAGVVPNLGGQSCQYFKNGQFVRGPCQNQKPNYGFGGGDNLSGFNTGGYQAGHRPPKRVGGSITYPETSGYGEGGSSSGHIKPQSGGHVVPQSQYGGYNKPSSGGYEFGQGGHRKPHPEEFGGPSGGYNKPKPGRPGGSGYGVGSSGGYIKPPTGVDGVYGGQSGYNKPSLGGHGFGGQGGHNKPHPGSSGYEEQGGYNKPGSEGESFGFGSKPGRPVYRPSSNKPGYGYGQQPGYGNKPNHKPGGDNHGGYEGGGQNGGHHNRQPGYKPTGSHRYQSKPCTTSDGLQGLCSPLSQCFYQFDDLNDLQENLCEKISKLPTVCCPVEGHRETRIQPAPIRIPKLADRRVDIQPINIQDIEEAARISKRIVAENLELEIKLVKNGLIQTPNSLESHHQAFFGGPDPLTRQTTKDGLIALETSIQLTKRYGLDKIEARDGLKAYSLLETSLREHCPKDPKCVQSKYRTADGSCNNLQNPLWGRSHTSFIRITSPEYADGLNDLRRARDGSALPGAREVSIHLATDVDLPDNKFTLLVMQWGQFMDHDLTLTASTRIDSDRGEGILCCAEEFARNPGIRHPACRPIALPPDDPFFSKHGRLCTNFVRNSPSPKPGCYLGAREQSNTLTHYIDGSMVYGSTADQAAHLRSFVKGQLRNSVINGVEHLPFDTQNRSDDCAIPTHRQLQCFVGGDVRVNEQTGLTILHMLLLREHNRIANKLAQIHPEWDDEILYQETRRIVAAVIQHVTLNEWTPLILGRRVMKEFNLSLKPSGYSYDYDPNLNGGILNAFATAAYRFHTLIQGAFQLMNNLGKITNKLQLRNVFNNPESVYTPGAYDEFLNCLTGQPAQTFDQFFTQELTNHLFQEHDKPFGMDLISLNIQRGRDHGLPGYNEFRKACGLPPINSWQQLAQVMRQGSAERMSKLYRSVDDIDLFIAGNHEKALPGGVVGPTFACILAEQTRRSKLGDRFWYENGDFPHSFTKEQLDEIRKSSLAGMICINSDNIETMQPLALLQPSELNPKIPCSEIPQINLDFWRNEKPFRRHTG